MAQPGVEIKSKADLIRYDKDFNWEGELAESWEISDDGLTMTFHLRRDVRWHDGKPFTSADVLFTYLLFIDPETPTASEGFHEAFETFRYDKALAVLWEQIGSINRDIETCKPWVWLKTGKIDRLHPKCTEWLTGLHTIAHWVQPFLPDTGQTIVNALSGCRITSQAPLFPRLNLAGLP